VPDGHGPGRWWALCRIAYAGELHYTAPVTVEVSAEVSAEVTA
jgi:alpha-mannosidase